MRNIVSEIIPIATVEQIRDASRYKARKIMGKFRANAGLDIPVVTEVFAQDEDVFLSVCSDNPYRAIWSVEETAHGRIFVPVGENVPNVEDYVLQCLLPSNIGLFSNSSTTLTVLSKVFIAL